jgi:hypothetical protein
VGEFDAYVPVTVVPNAGVSASENAWITAGPVFIAAGPGVRVKLGAKLAGTFAVKAEGAFGGSAGFLAGVAPELGVQLGF